MKTLVLVIETLRVKEDEYPVELYFDDGAADWRATPKAVDTIPAKETRQPYPHDEAGQPLCPTGVVKFLLEQNGASKAFEAVGEYLWELCVRGKVRNYWQSCWQTHAKTHPQDAKEGIRTFLDVRPPELRAFPWELMLREHVPLFGMPFNPVLRGPLVFPAPAPPVDSWVLRVLVLIGSVPRDATVDAEAEIEELEDAFRKFRRAIQFRVERPVSREALLDVYRRFRPHVLHFIGHGRQVPAVGNPKQSILEFHDAQGTPWDWEASQIRASFVQGPPRLAFLNACRTGALDTHEAIGAIADEFLAAGTLAVVAMQADIAGAAAANFAGSVYAALAVGNPLDIALAEARSNVRNKADMQNRRDWCLPSLVAMVIPSEVLPPRFAFTEERRREIEGTPEFAEIRAFVDRRDERSQVDPLAETAASRDLLIVKGDADAGKTALVHWCMEGCAWQKYRLKYVDLHRSTKPAFIEVLRWIRDRDPSVASELRGRLNGNFATFEDLARIIESGQKPASGAPDDPIEAVFSTFRAGLVDAAQAEPFVIALDHLGHVDADDFRKYLRPHLVDPIAKGQLRPIKLILGCTDEDYRAFDLRQLEPVAEVVTIRNFPAAEFDALVTEFLRYHHVPRQKASLVAQAFKPDVPWSPVVLRQIRDVLDRLSGGN